MKRALFHPDTVQRLPVGTFLAAERAERRDALRREREGQ